jgi:preprotein translocase subunit SecA
LINTLIAKVFGTANEREVKKLRPRVESINALEPEIEKLTDAELRAKTDEFRARIQERLAQVVEEGEPTAVEKERDRVLAEVLDDLMDEAFAVVREAGRRVLNMRHFDVQMIGGMVLHSGKIS